MHNYAQLCTIMQFGPIVNYAKLCTTMHVHNSPPPCPRSHGMMKGATRASQHRVLSTKCHTRGRRGRSSASCKRGTWRVHPLERPASPSREAVTWGPAAGNAWSTKPTNPQRPLCTNRRQIGTKKAAENQGPGWALAVEGNRDSGKRCDGGLVYSGPHNPPHLSWVHGADGARPLTPGRWWCGSLHGLEELAGEGSPKARVKNGRN